MSRTSPPSTPVHFAIVANAATPYRDHLHRRIVRELSDVKLFSVYTHEESNSPWKFDVSPETNPVQFGKGESSSNQGRLGGLWREWQKGGRIIRWMKQENVRAVLLLGYNDPGRLRIFQWCKRNNIPVLLWGDSNIHGDLARGIKRLIKKVFLGYLVKRADCVLCCGSLGKQYFLKYGADPDKIFYSPYEPDYALIQGISGETLQKTADRFGLKADRRRIVFSGRLLPHKNPDLLVRAFVDIADARQDWDMVMIGGGPLRGELEASVPERLRSRVIWTGFLDDQMAVSALYRLSDVLVLPSDYEPWALVVNEAVAAGLAIISSDVVGAAAELVRSGVNGYQFQAGSLPSLVDALTRLTNSDIVDAMKAASTGVLADWRQRADPVEGLRRSLRMMLPKQE